MSEDYLKAYRMITEGVQFKDREYKGPEEEGRHIRKCSILKETKVEYSNETIAVPIYKDLQ